jgi:predicted neuraminidase
MWIRQRISIVCALAFCLLAQLRIACHAQSEAQFDGVFRSNSNGIEEAYLETLFPSSHAANLLQLKNGSILCFWFSGSHEGDSNVAIAFSRLTRDSAKWTKPVVIDHQEGRSFQNPVAFQTPDGRIWLLHTSQAAGEGQTNAKILYATSDDDGATWTTPRPMFDPPGSFDRHPPILIDATHWILPMYYTPSRTITDGAESHYSAMQITADGGKTWKECTVPQSNGLVQPSIIRLKNGKFFALFRSRYADFIYESTSQNGCEWSVPFPTRFPNNNSSIQLTTLHDGSLALAFNNNSAGNLRGKPTTSKRIPLSIALSQDEGKSWPWIRDIETGRTARQQIHSEAVKKNPEEYSYPSVIQNAERKIYVAYSFSRETIKVVRFDEEWIKQGHTEGKFKGDSSN